MFLNPYKSKLAIGHGKWFLNTNLFLIKPFLITKFDCKFKLGDTEWLNSEQPGYSESLLVTNLPVYFINSKQPGVSKQFCEDQNVHNHLVCLHLLAINSCEEKTTVNCGCLKIYFRKGLISKMRNGREKWTTHQQKKASDDRSAKNVFLWFIITPIPLCESVNFHDNWN